MADAQPVTPQTAAPEEPLVKAFDPDGEKVQIPAKYAQAAMGQGYKIASPEQVQDAQDEQHYGSGVGNALTAAAAGAGRGATFGLSDQFLTKVAGVDPHTLQALKTHQAFASGAGEIAGIAGSALLAPEASPVGMLGKVGAATGNALTPAAQALTGSQVLSHAAGAALEAAGFSAGQSISENALGNDQALNADKLLANVGMGAVFGGALGGLFTGAGEVLPKAFPKAAEAVNSTADKLKDMLKDGFASATSVVSGKPKEMIRGVLDDMNMALLSPEEHEQAAEHFANTLGDLDKNARSIVSDYMKEVRPEETAKLLEGMDPTLAKQSFGDVMDKLQDTIKQIRAEPDIYPQGYARKLELIHERVSKALGEDASAADVFSELNGLKGRIDQEIKYGTVPSAGDQDAQKVIKSLRYAIKDNLEDESVWGEAAARQSSVNDAYSTLERNISGKNAFQSKFMYQTTNKSGQPEWLIDPTKVKTYLSQNGTLRGTVRDELLSNHIDNLKNIVNEVEKSYQSLPARNFDRKAVDDLIAKTEGFQAQAEKHSAFQKKMNALGGGGHNAYLGEGAALGMAAFHPGVAAAIEGVSLAAYPARAITRLAQLNKAIDATSNAVGRLSKAIFNPLTKTSEEYAGYLGSKISHTVISKKVSEYSNNPDKLMDHLNKATQDVYNVAPNHAGFLQASAARGIQFLNSKVPRPLDKKPLSPKYVPSRAEVEDFKRYYALVNNPLISLEQVKTGMITTKAVEVLQNVYPKLYQDMQTQVTSDLSDHLSKAKLLPYKTKMALSLFLNQDLDQSLTQQSIMSSQMAHQVMGLKNQAAQGAMQGQKSTQSGLSKLQASNQMLTAQQASAQREG